MAEKNFPFAITGLIMKESTMISKVKKLAIVSAIFAGGALAGTGAAFAYQPHMVNALSDLRAAYNQLSVATPDKGGHRVAAMSLVSRAIQQTQAGIADAR